MSESSSSEKRGEIVETLDILVSQESSEQEGSSYSYLSHSEEEHGDKEDNLGTSHSCIGPTQVMFQQANATIVQSDVKNNVDENFKEQTNESASNMENSAVIAQDSFSGYENKVINIPLLLNAISSTSKSTEDLDSTDFQQADNLVSEKAKTKSKMHRNGSQHCKSSKLEKANDLLVSDMYNPSRKVQTSTETKPYKPEDSKMIGTHDSNQQQKKRLRKHELTARTIIEQESVPLEISRKPRRRKPKHPGLVLVEPPQHDDQDFQQKKHYDSTGEIEQTSILASKASHNAHDNLVPSTKIVKQKLKNPGYKRKNRDGTPAEFTDLDLENQQHGAELSGAIGYSKYSGRGRNRSASESDAQVKSRKLEEYHRKFSSTNDKVHVKQLFKSENAKRRPGSQTIYQVDSNISEQVVEAVVSDGNYDFVETEDPNFLLANLAKKINGMKVECNSKYDKEMIDLKKSLSKISKKKVFLDEYKNVIAEKDNIRKSIDECGLRKDAFLAFCAELEEDTKEQLHSTSQSMALHACEVLQRKFERECQRYENALPIYARRSEILKIVHNHQTCVLIGETGSGKSTQVVQYLYEAGYAEHGIIACTQPRKLAARSLAEHVSNEVGEKGKRTYAYFGSDSKWKMGAKVVFMTDHTLLNECIADRRLSKYTVVVIDEAHERSIHTDILIALIKRCLPDRQDLRVIVTSATINPTMFSYYFGGSYDCPIIEVPGRIYPVDLKWENKKVSVLERNYVADSVDTAYDIHVKNKGKEGDILVFLTSPIEIEQACKLAQATMKNEVIVLPLHGKLQPEEQQKVFGKAPGKRKVVFSTNVAETSVTIPGIKFVIDTGLSKEMCYDPQRNVNSLEIRPISKSSANQRKGRAGRTGPGECYRLFSERDYKAMRDDSTPEILRITLSFAVIKLYEFGINDIHSFEFVDAPDKKALDDAVENLKFHGAIKDGKLTDIGKKMALLPLEPNLSKVLLDAIDKGIGAVGAAAVAISSLAGQVFFRPKEDLREESDQSRLPFCQDSGDQMTNLHTYFEWYNQSKNDRKDWCKHNYVNGKSMRMVKEMVEELVLILKQRSHVNILPSLESLANADNILPKLFFDAFMNNLCVHLGHDKIGYWCEKLPTEQLVLHYGSSLHYLRSYPQCVIFEKTQKTSQHFMLQVLPVREEWIQSAIESGKLPYHPCQAPLYSYYCVSGFTISNLGPTILSKLHTKYHPDRRNLVREFTEFDIQPLFEYCRERGELRVISQHLYHEKIRKSIYSVVEDIKKDLKKETYEDGINGENDDVRVIMTEGGVIQRVLMPDEFQGIKVRGVHHQFKEMALEELQKYGECKIECGKCLQDGTVPLFIRFQDPSDAYRALQHTFESFNDPHVVIHRMHGRHRNDFCLKVSWARRERRDFAYINLNEEQRSVVIRPFIRDKISSLQFQYTEEKQSIRVRGLRPDMDEGYIKSRLLLYCPALTEIDVHFIYEDPFDESRESYLEQKLQLEDRLSMIIPRHKYFMDFPFPNRKFTKYIAYVHFDDSADCITAEEELCDYIAEMSLLSSVRYTSQIFSVIRPSIESIARSFAGLITYDKKDRWGNVFVKISAQDINSFIDARDAISEATEPSVISFDENEGKYASTASFLKTVRQIEAETETHIRLQSLNICNNTITIYGTEKNREKAKTKVKEHLSSLITPEVNFFEINLKDYSCGTLRHLVVKYGPEARNISDDFEGIRATMLDFRKHVLLLFSTHSSYEALIKYLENFEGSSNMSQRATNSEQELSSSFVCCVCYETHAVNTIFYRLECCGHVYCLECIKMQIDPLTIKFPVTCAADNCEQNLVWKDFENLSKSKVIQLQAIKLSALKYFVSVNPSVYHHCTTPDCDMIYAITERGERFVCSQCGANICTCCHGNWHEGYATCAAYQNHKERDTTVEDQMSRYKGNREKYQRGGRFMCSQCGCNSCTCRHGNLHEGYATSSAYQSFTQRDTVVEDQMSRNRGNREKYQRRERFMCSQCGRNSCTCHQGNLHEGYATSSDYQNRTRRDTVVEDQMSRNRGNYEKYQRRERFLCSQCGANSCTCHHSNSHKGYDTSLNHTQGSTAMEDRMSRNEWKHEKYQRGKQTVCSQCGANSCTCHQGNSHKGYDTSSAYHSRTQRYTSVDDRMSTNRGNHKKCPKCGVTIEENGGCRKVTCIKCRAYICLICLQYYGTDSECREHLRRRHGEILNNPEESWCVLI